MPKTKFKLVFFRWSTEEKPPLELASTEGELSTGSPPITATADIPVDQLYQLLRNSNVDAKYPLMLMQVID